MSSFRSSKTWVGIAIGLTFAVVGPFLALAQHDSGEESGDDPFQVTTWNGQSMVTDAAFRMQESNGSFDAIDLSFTDQWQSPGQSAGWHVDEDGNITGSDCGQQCVWPRTFTWTRCEKFGSCRKEERPTNGYLSTSATVMLAGPVTFDGQVGAPSWIDATDRCRLNVTWSDLGAPRVMAAPDARTGPHGGSATTDVRVGRAASASLEASCPTADGDVVVAATSFDASVWVTVGGSERAIVAPEG